ncbi:MAG: LamG domain-containing protein, partial [Nitrosarchaeum sp.]|nr:LamG domain-containing protein [Nitrosarchaeum sp.]
MNVLTISVLLSICFGVLSFGNALGHDDFTDYNYQKPTMHHDMEEKIIDKFLSWNIGEINSIQFSDHLTVNQDLENSIHFDRESDFMSFKPHENGDRTKISILVFVKPHFNNANNMTVIEQKNTFRITLNDNGGYHAEFSIFDGNQWIDISSPVILKEKWTPIFAEYDGFSIKLLVNDVSLVEKQLDITSPIFGRHPSLLHSDHEIVLGASKSTSGFSNFYSGDIDEVQFYTNNTSEYSFGGTLDTFENAFVQLSDQTAIEPINQTAIEPINQTAIEPINQTAIEPINQTAIEP